DRSSDRLSSPAAPESNTLTAPRPPATTRSGRRSADRWQLRSTSPFFAAILNLHAVLRPLNELDGILINAQVARLCRGRLASGEECERRQDCEWRFGIESHVAAPPFALANNARICRYSSLDSIQVCGGSAWRSPIWSRSRFHLERPSAASITS